MSAVECKTPFVLAERTGRAFSGAVAVLRYRYLAVPIHRSRADLLSLIPPCPVACRPSNLFSPARTYLKRCCDDPSRSLPRSVQQSPAARRSRQGSGSLEEADRDGRGIPPLCRTAGRDALR